MARRVRPAGNGRGLGRPRGRRQRARGGLRLGNSSTPTLEVRSWNLLAFSLQGTLLRTDIYEAATLGRAGSIGLDPLRGAVSITGTVVDGFDDDMRTVTYPPAA